MARDHVSRLKQLLSLLMGNEDQALKDIERSVADIRRRRRANSEAVENLLEELTRQADANDRDRQS